MNNPLFRPPAEADSLILQVDQGCPYNQCSFCGMYKDVPYRRLDLAEVHKLIERESRYAHNAKRVFLADGDVMRRPADELRAILEELNACLPNLARVNVYTTGNSIMTKSPQELKALHDLKLNTLYMGLESGDEETLKLMNKGETAEHMVEAALRAQSSGLKMSIMVLLGLGGTERTARHASATTTALNRMQPRLLAMLRIIPVPGTTLYEDVRQKRFHMLSEYQAVEELRHMVKGLDLHNTVFRANHTSNVIPLEARFPRDKKTLIEDLDRLLSSGDLDKNSPGEMPLWL
jgi:radical SAM superfamily enzyme YgiQ (UPF0313 family)